MVRFGNYTPPVKEQPEGSVNVYVGMFFDGTGNNRYNSEAMYYTHIKSNADKIPAADVPALASYTNVVVEKDGTKKKQELKITDSDSHWNPYTNIVKLHDLYKEIKEKDYVDPQHKNMVNTIYSNNM